jgi:hypothetical protein
MPTLIAVLQKFAQRRKKRTKPAAQLVRVEMPEKVFAAPVI